MKKATQVWRKSICTILLSCALVFSIFGCVRLTPPETEPSASVLEPGSATESSGATELVQETTPTVKKRLVGCTEYNADGSLISEMSRTGFIGSLPGESTTKNYWDEGVFTYTEKYTYDSVGRVIRCDYYRESPYYEPAIGVIKYEFDEQDRMIKNTRQENDSKEYILDASTYDENGNLVFNEGREWMGGGSKAHYEYNALGQLILETQIDIETRVTAYEYYPDGTVSHTTLTSEDSGDFKRVETSTYHYEYGENGELVSKVIDLTADGTRYDDDHLVMEGQIVIQYEYNAEGLLIMETQEQHEYWKNLTSDETWDNATSFKDTYQYDADGQETNHEGWQERTNNSSGEPSVSTTVNHETYIRSAGLLIYIHESEYKYSQYNDRDPSTTVTISDMDGNTIIDLYFPGSVRYDFDDDGYLIKIECDESASVLNWEEFE